MGGTGSIIVVHSVSGSISKLRWDTHTDTLCKTLSKRVFLLSKLKYIVDTDILKFFFNADIKSHIDYASVVWDGCSDALKKTIKFSTKKIWKANPSR